MSLINQMLIDLEQRGAGSNDERRMITPPSSVMLATGIAPNINQHYQAKHGFSILKISGFIILLVGGIYLWVQGSPALSQNIDLLNANVKPLVLVKQQSPEITQKPSSEIKTVSTVQTLDKIAPPLFESTLKYTPIEYKLTSSEFQPKQDGKYVQRDKAIANIIQGELLANNVTNTNQATKSVGAVKSVEMLEPLQNFMASDNSLASAKLDIAAKPSLHSSNSNILKQISPEQKSGNLYRQALANLQQGRVAEAQSNLAQALESYPANQEARQTFAGLLLDNNRTDEARATLSAGLAIAPEQTNFRITLARLQIELGDKATALTTMEQGLAYATNNSDYQSFFATLLQRANRHDEAISHYKIALTMNPFANSSSLANSLVGLGISLQATGKLESAQEAFTRAQSTTALSPELSQFIEQQLKHNNQSLRTSAIK